MQIMSEKKVIPSPPFKDGTKPQAASAPQVFDPAARQMRRQRAAARTARLGTPAFFTERCIDDVADRLQDIARQFERALIIGPMGTWDAVADRLPTDKHPKSVTLAYDGPTLGSGHSAPDDALPFDAGQFDLVISILSLHSVNDLPGGLMNLRHILEADGLMMASVFGGDSLHELRQSFYTAESAINGQMSPRIFPMIDFSQAASLLQRAGFALPVVDTDRFTVNYSTPARLIADLRDQGETNILIARDKTPLSRRLSTALWDAYRAQFGTESGKLRASFEILWLTGWVPHARQQKPLKPGSAKMRLADALGVKEQKP